MGLALGVARTLGEMTIVEGVARLAATAGRIASGDLAARAGRLNASREIVELGAAMDRMAENLERELARRADAEHELRVSHGQLESRVGERTAELSQAVEALGLSEHLHRVILENSPFGMAYFDASGHVLKSNQQFEAFRKCLEDDESTPTRPSGTLKGGQAGLSRGPGRPGRGH